jgi:hypothetical protein
MNVSTPHSIVVFVRATSFVSAHAVAPAPIIEANAAIETSQRLERCRRPGCGCARRASWCSRVRTDVIASTLGA